jgi:hypothetical protein
MRRDRSLPSCLRVPTLFDETGLPRYWATAWAAPLPGDLAPATLSKHLSYVESFYTHSDQMLGIGRLDDALASVDVETLGQAIEGYFQFLRNRVSVTPVSEARWQIVARFIRNTVTRLTKSAASPPRIDDLQTKLVRIEIMFSQLRAGQRRKLAPIRSLPAVVVEALYHFLDPRTSANPFRNEATRWRVWILFVLLLHQGLRRGELLNLPVDAIKSGFDGFQQRGRYWLTVKYNVSFREGCVRSSERT